MTLPSSKQTWAHSIVSKDLLERTLEDPNITAIETDILLGYDTTTTHEEGTTNELGHKIPIMAHPPDTESDLSVGTFLERIRTTQHHIKLDFKQQVVVPPTLELLQAMLRQDANNCHTRTFFFNADILPGPGMEDPTVPAKPFLETTTAFKTLPGTTVALSLGWKVDVCSPYGYTHTHMAQMNEVLQKYVVDTKIPIVLAVNARLLAKSPPEPFLNFLLATRQRRQLLIWTGSGEPPIGSYTLQKLEKMFAEVSDQVGYDVQTTTNTMEATLYDTAMWFLGWKNIIVRKLWKLPTTIAELCFATRNAATERRAKVE